MYWMGAEFLPEVNVNVKRRLKWSLKIHYLAILPYTGCRKSKDYKLQLASQNIIKKIYTIINRGTLRKKLAVLSLYGATVRRQKGQVLVITMLFSYPMDIKIEEGCKKQERKFILDSFHNAVYYKPNFQNVLQKQSLYSWWFSDKPLTIQPWISQS